MSTTPRFLFAVAPVAALGLLLTGCGGSKVDESQLPRHSIPAVTGMPLDSARAAMSSAGVTDPMAIAYGSTESATVGSPAPGYIVTSQNPQPGATVTGNAFIELDVAKESEIAAESVLSAVAASAAAEQAAHAGEVTYTITGAGTASVTYMSIGEQISQETEVTLPWTKVLSGFGSGGAFLSVNAQHTSDDPGAINCEIQFEGSPISTNTSSGQYAIADCSATTS